jgi:hypothetical protein
MSIPLVFNIYPFDVNGDLASRGHLPTRDQQHCSAAPLVYVSMSKRTDDTRVKLRYCATQISLLSLIRNFAASAMWLLPQCVVAENR